MDRDELAAWLRLTLTPGIGNQAARRLLVAFGLPQAIFDQPLEVLKACIGTSHAAALHSEPEKLANLVETTWQWLQAGSEDGPAHAVVPLGHRLYPPALLETSDPPLLLYLLGPARILQADAFPAAPCLAMVGSRNPTPQGQDNARQFARALRAAGLTIVSGLALGIDGAAHEGALADTPSVDSAPATIAVVGTGLDRVYPQRHRELAHRIAADGLLVSEYPLGTPPLAANFPKRNRIISGLSLGTLVVEAAPASGSLITARMASEQGREVFAIPGSIHAIQSRGCHALIRQGAKLVESAQDVLEELQYPASAGALAENAASAPAAAPAPHGLLDAMGFDPIGLDALQARTGLDTPGLQVQLLELELAGALVRMPGGLFQRMAQA